MIMDLMDLLEHLNFYYGYEAKNMDEFIEDFKDDFKDDNELAVSSLLNVLKLYTGNF